MRRRVFATILSESLAARLISSLSPAFPVSVPLALRGACGPAMTRPPLGRPDLEKLRATEDEQTGMANRKILGRLLERIKAEHERNAAGQRKKHPIINILI